MKKIILSIFLTLVLSTGLYAQDIFTPPTVVSELDGSPSGVATSFLLPNGSLSITGSVATLTYGSGSGDLLADGSVPLTADWDVGAFKITAEQFESDIADGTTPFIVASTTLVANLNADLLDGNEASAFQTALGASTDDIGIGIAANIGSQLNLPGEENDPASPTLSFNGDTGFYEAFANHLVLALNGSGVFQWTGVVAGGTTSDSGAYLNESTSSTNPTLVPGRDDLDTGIGSNDADQLSIIVGAIEGMRFIETGTVTTDQVILFPDGSHVGDASSTPTLAWGDGDTGWYENTDDNLNLAISGNLRWQFTSSVYFKSSSNNRAALYGGSDASTTTPTVLARSIDTDTGMGGTEDNGSLIAGGAEALRWEDPNDLGATETSLWIFDDDNAAIQQVTVGADDSGGAGFKVLRIPN